MINNETCNEELLSKKIIRLSDAEKYKFLQADTFRLPLLSDSVFHMSFDDGMLVAKQFYKSSDTLADGTPLTLYVQQHVKLEAIHFKNVMYVDFFRGQRSKHEGLAEFSVKCPYEIDYLTLDDFYVLYHQEEIAGSPLLFFGQKRLIPIDQRKFDMYVW